MQDTMRGDLLGESPLLTSKNEKRKENKELKKDSCVEFKMAKDNVMTGKTDTIA